MTSFFHLGFAGLCADPLTYLATGHGAGFYEPGHHGASHFQRAVDTKLTVWEGWRPFPGQTQGLPAAVSLLYPGHPFYSVSLPVLTSEFSARNLLGQR